MYAASVILFLSLIAVSSLAPVTQSSLRAAISRSATLSWKILLDVRALSVQYLKVDSSCLNVTNAILCILNTQKAVKLRNPTFEDHNLKLRSLPNCQIDYGHWLDMQDGERLKQTRRDLQIFWMHVDAKRIHELTQTTGSESSESEIPGSALLSPIEGISVDLRDLISQLNGQISALNSTSLEPLDLSLPLNILNPDADWHSKMQGYIIFRDLEIYLNKVIRDFTLLKSKY